MPLCSLNATFSANSVHARRKSLISPSVNQDKTIDERDEMPDSSVINTHMSGRRGFVFLDPEGGSQKATLVVLLVIGISSPRVQKCLRLPNTQRSATKLCISILADIAHRSTVSTFPVIFN